MTSNILIGISKAAQILRWRYGRTYDAALAGTFGPLERIEGRLFVAREAVEAYASGTATPAGGQ